MFKHVYLRWYEAKQFLGFFPQTKHKYTLHLEQVQKL
jgi:hypothetical protein